VEVLKEHFSMLFNLVLEKNVTEKDMALASSVERGRWSWRRNFCVEGEVGGDMKLRY